MSDTKFWLNIIGWTFVAMGVMYGITIVGLIFAWLPVWMGLSLTKAAKAADNLQRSGDPEEVVNYLSGVKVYFMITGIGMLLGLIVTIGMFLFVLSTGGLAALIALSEQGQY